jgi:hypothetical protein
MDITADGGIKKHYASAALASAPAKLS